MRNKIFQGIVGTVAVVALVFVTIAESHAGWGSFGGGSFGSRGGGSFGHRGGGSFGHRGGGSLGRHRGGGSFGHHRGGSFGSHRGHWGSRGHSSHGSRGHHYSYGHGSHGHHHSYNHGSHGHGHVHHHHGSHGGGYGGYSSYNGGHSNYVVQAQPANSQPAYAQPVVRYQPNRVAEAKQAPAKVEVDADSDEVVTSVTLNVPENATVELCGRKMSSNGPVRHFVTRQLKSGEIWTNYQIKVSYLENGKLVSRSKTINLKAGDEKNFEFGSQQDLIASK